MCGPSFGSYESSTTETERAQSRIANRNRDIAAYQRQIDSLKAANVRDHEIVSGATVDTLN